jgi:tRNA G10  N-methylase Trm11
MLSLEGSGNRYVFEIGREWKLSLAEIEAIFGRTAIIFHSQKIVLVESEFSPKQIAEIGETMGGTIRILELVETMSDPQPFVVKVKKYLSKQFQELFQEETGKIPFALGTIGEKRAFFNQGLRLKKELKAMGFNARIINKEDANVSTALVKREQLIRYTTEYMLVNSKPGEYMLARTIFIQDIDAYTKRDTQKERDMQVGMLPPKLAQIMLHLAIGRDQFVTSDTWGKVGLYDPFCGLGTVLIEAKHRKLKTVFGSDISPEMVEATKKNTQNENECLVLDARKIGSAPFLSQVTHIVTEGYLGKIFSQKSVTYTAVVEEKKALLHIFEGFFASLKAANWHGTIVFSVPCWETTEASIYFAELYPLLMKEQIFTLPLLTEYEDVKLTRYGTLIYRRPGQTVGREIVRVKI